MAECHPVAYQWVTEARLKGAKVIHVDPRFTRTSATSDKHIPIRAGSDVVLLGALINHILSNELYFKEYVVAYTNAATLVSEKFQDTEDLDGLFSGYDDEKGSYAHTRQPFPGSSLLASDPLGGDPFAGLQAFPAFVEMMKGARH